MSERSSLKPAAASVASLAPQGLQAGKPPLPLGRPFTLIGARNRAHLHLLSSAISRNHACIIATDNGLYLRDLASRTGVSVNGRRVKEIDLRDGDLVGIGPFKFKFTDPAGPVRFPITPKAAPAMLEIDGATLTPLDSRSLLIGRRPNCDVPLTEAAASNSHALIFEANGHHFVRDLGSRTGTLVNGKPIHHQLLELGDEVRIGQTCFRYLSAEAREEPAPAIPLEEQEQEHESVQEQELEPIGLHFADEPAPQPAASNGEWEHDDNQPIPLVDETDHDFAAPSEAVGEPVDLGLEFTRTEAEHHVTAAAPELDAPPQQVPEHEPEYQAGTEPAAPLESAWEPEPVAEAHDTPEAPELESAPELKPVEDVAMGDEVSHAGEPAAEPPPEITGEPSAPQVLTAHFADLEPAPGTSLDESHPERESHPPEVSEQAEEAGIIPVAEEAVPASTEDLAPPPVEEPTPAPAEDLVPPFVEESVPEPAEDLAPSPVEEPTPPFAEDLAPLPAEEPAPPFAEDFTPPPVEEVVPPSAEDRAPTAAEEFAPPQPEDLPTAPPEEPALSAAEELAPPPVEETVPSLDAEPPAAPSKRGGRAPRTPKKKSSAPRRSSKKKPAPVLEDVIETTEPTPESALDLDLEPVTVEPSPAPHELQDSAADAALTDTAFGRVVQEFSGPELGPLVEQPAGEPPANEPTAPAAESLDPAMDAPADEFQTPQAEAPAVDAPAPESDALPDEFPAIGAEPPAIEDRHPEVYAAATETPVPEADAPALEAPVADASTPAESWREIHFEAEPAPELAAAPTPPPSSPEEDFGLEFVASEPLIQPGEPAITTESLAAPSAAPPLAPEPPMATDPFFGMTRDLGSFIGGMPLPLASSGQSPPSESTLTFSDDPDALPPLDDALLADPEPLELFDGTAETLDALPEGLGFIDDLGGVLAGDPHPTSAESWAPPAPASPGNKSAPAPPPPSRPQPPPPGRRLGLRSITADAGAALAGAASPHAFGAGPASTRSGIGAGAAPRPAMRITDVFSQTAFPGPADPVFGGPSAPVPPIPPMAPKQGRASMAPGAAPGSAPAGRTRPEPIPPNRQPAVRTSSASAAAPVVQRPGTQTHGRQPSGPGGASAVPTPARPRPWYKRFGILLSLMIAAIIIVIVIVLLLPQRHLLQGTLQIKGLDNMDVFAQREQVRELRAMLASPDVRNTAEGNLAAQKIAYGFVQDPVALDALADPRNSPFDEARAALVLTRRTADPSADLPRMRAILAAVYARGQSANDRAASAHAKLAAAQAGLATLEQQNAALETQIAKMSGQITAMGPAEAQALLLAPDAGLLQLQQNDVQFRQSLNTAAEQVADKRQALEQAQASAARLNAAGAAQVAQIRQSIADLTSRLTAARLARNRKTGQAANTFEAAMSRFDGQLAALPSNPADPNLAAYLARARDLSDQIRQLDSQLAIRQHDDAEAVAQLRRQLADRREAHLRQAWASDARLKEMIEERDAQAHHFSVASDSGYASEAMRIKAILDGLDQKIDARRGALAAGGTYSDELQQKLQQAIDRMEQSRQRDERQMAAKLSALDALAPAPNSVAAGQRRAVADLIADASAMSAARGAYAGASSLSAADAGVQARQLQARLSDQQARLDSLQQGRRKSSAVAQAQHALDAAQQQAATASTAFISNHALLAALREFVDAKKHAADLSDTLHSARDQAASRKADADKIAVIQQPDANSVAVIYAPDQRLGYLVSGLLAIAALFAIPLWMSLSEPAPRVPMAIAVAEGFDVMHHPALPFDDAEFDPAEHPAAV